MTLLRSLTILSSLGLLASAGQIPKVDGVYGGVRTSTTESTPTPAFKEAVAQVSGTPVAGKLRFVENSGICGMLQSGPIRWQSLIFLCLIRTKLCKLETTSGVYQASGYADITDDQSLW